jgi:hypothetical protein
MPLPDEPALPALTCHRFHMSYKGQKAHQPHHQECPATFCDRRLHTLAFYGAPHALTEHMPGPWAV